MKLITCIFIAAVVFVAHSEDLRGDRVGWARLKTPSKWWNRHAHKDPILTQFLRNNTSLNIDPTWNNADVENLPQMSAYPILFSQGIDMVRSTTGQTNLAEYMRRSGFVVIDACINEEVTPNPDIFLARQTQLLAKILPEAQVVLLPPDHNVYRCYFSIPEGKPPHTYPHFGPDPRWSKHRLYGIQIGSRMAGVISLSALQCGWAGVAAPPGTDLASMKMLVNNYIYSMMQGD